jgi:hypothetical protein
MNVLKAWCLGVRDGWAQPHELTMGMSWRHNQDMNEAYDRGVNFGQRIRSPRNHQR